MVHVYRDQPAPRHRIGDLIGSAVVALFLLPLVIGVVHGARHGFAGDDVGGIAFGLFVGSLLAWAFYTHFRRECFEIRLGDDGMCEFVTGRGVIRLHVHEITAVKYRKDDEGGESYSVRYRGGRIGLRSSIADLRDFLTRLQALNPAIDLTSFPDAWLRPVSVRHDPPVERTPRRLLRVVPLLLVAAIGVPLVIAIEKAEPANLYPTSKDAVSEHTFTRPLLTETSGVWLVPLGEPRRVDVTRLANELAARYGIPVAVLPDIALPRWTLDTNESSLVGDELIRLLGQAYGVEGWAAIIGVTDYEMYDGNDHVFSLRESAGHYGVVSTSPLGSDPSDLLWHGHNRHVRTRKLIARNIGFLYYHRPEVNDSHSLLRPSMNGADDIDKLTEAL
jgi:hypothetical protein